MPEEKVSHKGKLLDHIQSHYVHMSLHIFANFIQIGNKEHIKNLSLMVKPAFRNPPIYKSVHYTKTVQMRVVNLRQKLSVVFKLKVISMGNIMFIIPNTEFEKIEFCLKSIGCHPDNRWCANTYVNDKDRTLLYSIMLMQIPSKSQ